MECLLVFSSHNQAVFLYNALIRKGYPLKLVSTPCTISSGCTQSLRFKEEYAVSIVNEARLMNMSIKGVYRIVRKNNVDTYQQIEIN